MLEKEEGELAVKIARKTIEHYLATGEVIDRSDFEVTSIFYEQRGVFVTLNKKGALRGCIGRPYPDLELIDAIIDSAISAATKDPRFPPVHKKEMADIVVEITVMTKPELIDIEPESIPEMISIGKHGLIIKKGYYQGLLLPQVASDHQLDEVEFLCHTCLKAGLSPHEWETGNVNIYRFEGQIFKEKVPRGNIIEESLDDSSCR
nr:TIGR00296 family protein [Methanosalsum zhilinae]